MKQFPALTSILVRDYDEAIRFYTDDFWRDYRAYREKGVEFVRGPRAESYGTVAVFRGMYGNLWDLLQPVEESEVRR